MLYQESKSIVMLMCGLRKKKPRNLYDLSFVYFKKQFLECVKERERGKRDREG